jgi:NAD(P)-dependent dehydrogenase (short-subunit alcohol dehydrogenase family)
MKTVVITGANAGIGFATAKLLAARPDWHVLLACRNSDKANAAIREIRQAHPRSSVDFVPLDLFSLSSVHNFVATIAESGHAPLHGLILNAGGINMKAKGLEFTEDGFERTFQLNFLGHFLLVTLLIQQMSVPGRVIFVSSDLHDPAATKMGKIAPPRYGPLEDMAYGRGTAAKMTPMARYGTAKMYAMMAAYELDRRLRTPHSRESIDSITVNSWSPGVVPTTQAGRDMPVILKTIMMSSWFVTFMGSHLSSENEAAAALGGLLVDPAYSGVSGRYFDGFAEIPSSDESRDEQKAKAVWEQAMALLTSSEKDAYRRPYGNKAKDARTMTGREAGV